MEDVKGTQKTLFEMMEEGQSDAGKPENNENEKESLIEEEKNIEESSEEKEEETNTEGSSENIEELKKKLEHVTKVSDDRWKIARTAQNKMNEIKKAVQGFIEAGYIEEDKGEELVSLLKIDGLKKAEIMKMEDGPRDPLEKYTDMIDRDLIDAYKDMIGDEGAVEENVRAFGMLWEEASDEEREALLEDFEEASKKSKAALFKAILKAGESFTESAPGLKEFRTSGGLRAFLKKNHEEKESLQKQIDKLKKRLDDKNSVLSAPTRQYLGRGSEAHSEGPTSTGRLWDDLERSSAMTNRRA